VEVSVRCWWGVEAEDEARCSWEGEVEEVGLRSVAEPVLRKLVAMEAELELNCRRRSSSVATAVPVHGLVEAEEQQSVQVAEVGSMESEDLQMVVALHISQMVCYLRQAESLAVGEVVEDQDLLHLRMPDSSRVKQEHRSRTFQHLQAEEVL